MRDDWRSGLVVTCRAFHCLPPAAYDTLSPPGPRWRRQRGSPREQRFSFPSPFSCRSMSSSRPAVVKRNKVMAEKAARFRPAGSSKPRFMHSQTPTRPLGAPDSCRVAESISVRFCRTLRSSKSRRIVSASTENRRRSRRLRRQPARSRCSRCQKASAQ